MAYSWNHVFMSTVTLIFSPMIQTFWPSGIGNESDVINGKYVTRGFIIYLRRAYFIVFACPPFTKAKPDI